MRKLQELGNQHSEVLSILQLCAVNKPFLPNLKTIKWLATREIIPLFLSPRTAVIGLGFEETTAKGLIASMITTLPTLCPNLQDISLHSLPRDPIIDVAVDGMLLVSNRNTLQYLDIDSPLPKDACEIIYKLPNLHELSVVIEGPTSLPTMVLPNLTEIVIKFDHDRNWLQGFRGATLGKLESTIFHSESEPIGDFLEAFESVACTTSIPETLSAFRFYTSRSWRPNYRSLLPFTHLKEINIGSSCEHGCSSTADDDTIIDLARAMPRLEILRLGEPCRNPTGITTNGLTALAYYCPRLASLRIHFRAASLLPPVTIPGGATSSSEPIIPRVDCTLTSLSVGKIPLPEESVLMVKIGRAHV